MKIKLTRNLPFSYGAGVEKGTVHEATIEGGRAYFKTPRGVIATANIGYYTIVPADPVPQPQSVQPTPVQPDFEAMTKDQLVAYGAAQDPPIDLDSRERKDVLIDQLQSPA